MRQDSFQDQWKSQLFLSYWCIKHPYHVLLLSLRQNFILKVLSLLSRNLRVPRRLMSRDTLMCLTYGYSDRDLFCVWNTRGVGFLRAQPPSVRSFLLVIYSRHFTHSCLRHPCTTTSWVGCDPISTTHPPSTLLEYLFPVRIWVKTSSMTSTFPFFLPHRCLPMEFFTLLGHVLCPLVSLHRFRMVRKLRYWKFEKLVLNVILDM